MPLFDKLTESARLREICGPMRRSNGPLGQSYLFVKPIEERRDCGRRLKGRQSAFSSEKCSAVSDSAYGIRHSQDRYWAGAYLDIRSFISPNSAPVIFDVGANVGQTMDALRQIFARPTIHAFEPDKGAFDNLLQTHSKLPHVSLNNLALGSKPGRKIFF